MKLAREICSFGHVQRQKAGIPTRQPLQSITIPKNNLEEDFLQLIRDELNIKEVIQI